jgi:heterodisulfide reductase subunit C1
MSSYYLQLEKDIRFKEGLRACINCGTCSAICPAGAFYNYDPKKIVTLVQNHNEEEIENLLKSETIWYCGECMSCKTRCPRGNTPGLIIMALRQLSIETGLFVESEKGRQILALKRAIGSNILKYGYCVYVETVDPELHPEQGPIWKWIRKNAEKVYNRLGGNYKKEGAGALRKIADTDLSELDKIFEVTGAHSRFEKIESFSKIKAKEMGYETKNEAMDPYFLMVYRHNSGKHYKQKV